MRRRFLSFLQRFRMDRSGASAIEFAIVATVFFTLIFGIMVYGFYFASLSIVDHIAYESARATIGGLSDGERGALAQARATELIAAYDRMLATDTVEVETGPVSEGVYGVTVRHDFSALGMNVGAALMPLPPSTQSATVTISYGGY